MKPKILVSSCLLGNSVRYDAGHKKDSFILNELSRFFDFVTICPEVESGMTVPRESMSLKEIEGAWQLLGNKTATNYTNQLLRFSKKAVSTFDEEIVGAILKKKSPSCGVKPAGLFSMTLHNEFPFLPMIDEGRLFDSRLRVMFFAHLFIMVRWRELMQLPRKKSHLLDFHERHKLVLMGKDNESYKSLGNLLGTSKLPIGKLYETYFEGLMVAAVKETTVKRHINVLLHIMGYFKKELTAEEKEEMLQLIEEYRKGDVPLIVPLTLLNHYVRKFDQQYLKKQIYLSPFPSELRLNNLIY